WVQWPRPLATPMLTVQAARLTRLELVMEIPATVITLMNVTQSVIATVLTDKLQHAMLITVTVTNK
ncbi:hypothetical protein CHS0354_039742, partial [Potamilus streckersoni]